MAKNNYIIEQHKALAKLRKLTNQNVAEIYACFCKVLYEDYKWQPDAIEELFTKTQEMWNELAATDTIADMVTWCEKTTNIKLMNGDL